MSTHLNKILGPVLAASSRRWQWEGTAAPLFVLMNLFSYRRSAFHVEGDSTLIGAR